MVTSNIIEALVSVKRLSTFFNADELQPDVRQVVNNTVLEQGDVVVSVTNGEFSWNKNAVSPTLEGINLTVRKGELVGVLGRVGAGKVRWIPSDFYTPNSSCHRRACCRPSLAKWSAPTEK